MSEIVNLPEITITDSTYQRSTSEKDALDHIPNNENDPLNQSTIKVNKKKKVCLLFPQSFFFFSYIVLHRKRWFQDNPIYLNQNVFLLKALCQEHQIDTRWPSVYPSIKIQVHILSNRQTKLNQNFNFRCCPCHESNKSTLTTCYTYSHLKKVSPDHRCQTNRSRD